MKTAVTICLVPEARQGPFVLHGGIADLPLHCRTAADLGFDGVEIFPESGEAFPAAALAGLLPAHGLALAAVGTGAGWVKHGLHVCHEDAAMRERATAFIERIVDAAGSLGSPAIVGSMQGKSGGEVSREAALDHLAAALERLGARAARHGQVLLYEPLNRYETNLFNRQAEAAAFLDARGIGPVRLLCDLFHMNIEEESLGRALEAAGPRVGHVHWADSNRRALGFGHTDPRPVVAALRRIGYAGYLSAEVFPLPAPLDAARQTVAGARAALS
jgi:sugar phosphate isomerase/epimerase